MTSNQDHARHATRDSSSPTTTARPVDHVACIYRDEFDLYSAAGRFLRQRIRRGDSVCIVAEEESRVVLQSMLEGVGVDFDDRVRHGQILVRDAEDTLESFMVGGIATGRPDPEAFAGTAGRLLDEALAHGRYDGAAVYGEMANLLWESGNTAAAIALEGLWNDLRATRRFTLFCPHGRASVTPSDEASFAALCALHSELERAYS